jgi:tetratricopeptide (TPR) repeat protein
MAVRADELFVFAGAGASFSMPANLPVFNALRDEVLNQLDLKQYMWPGNGQKETRPQKVAGALAPELFMLGLSEAHVGVERWLSDVLSGTHPNAVHYALAALAAAGSRVWTVNFDTLIEQASGNVLRTVAWPENPLPDTQLLKPHGSAGGELIVTARQVIGRLGEDWAERLRSDVRGRTVLFIGYRGRDLDFQPIWDEVLSEAARVVWFDRWADREMSEADFKRKLLAGIDARGKLELARPASLPRGAPFGPGHNPSWDFIAWCQDRGLINIEPDLVLQLFDSRPEPERRRYPPLPGDKVSAKPIIQGMLGDYKGARASYWRAALMPGHQWKAAKGLASSHVMHGGDPMAALLSTAVLLPPYGRIGRARELALRMRLTAWSSKARHQAVLRATRDLPEHAASVYLILRSEAMRVTASLDEAAAFAADARDKAAKEKREVRLANAAFQQCLALLWAERLDEVRAHLNSFVEYAPLAGNRWTAWANFVEAGLYVHRGDGQTAHKKYEEAALGFTAEGLLDGVISVDTARLTAYRLTGNTAEYEKTLKRVKADSHAGAAGTKYYTRGNDFTAESILNDEAEYTRCTRGDLDTAQNMYEQTAASRYPLQSVLGHLGLALIQGERGQSPSHATQALRIAENIGCRLVAARSRELLAQPLAPDALRQVYFV